MVNDAELKIKIFRLIDAQKGKTLEEIYRMLVENLYETAVQKAEGEEEVRSFYAQTDTFSFWEDPREDLYQDYLDKNQ